MCNVRPKEAVGLCHEGRLSLYCFLATIALVLLPSAPQIHYGVVPQIWGAMLWGPFLYYALINMVLRYIFRNNNYQLQIAMRASFLGFVQAISLLLVFFAPAHWKQFGVYGCFMSFFHYTEFLCIAWSSPASLSVSSFMLYHSPQYAVAAVCSWLEFALEVHFLPPQLKGAYYIWLLGVLFCVVGEIIRKLAIITARQNFTHLVQFQRHENHKLVTHGIYAFARHPSYVGWFWWSIGTQIILLNPICIVAYTIASWIFFHDRIFMEELALLQFFPSDYQRYQEQVPTGLPFIKGCVD